MIARLPARYRRVPPPPGQAVLIASLRPWERRLLRESLAKWLLRGALGGLVLASLVLLIGWFAPIPEDDLRPWAAELFPIPLLAAALLGMWPRAHRLHASVLDARLGFNDRLATAWSLRAFDTPIASLQRSDTLDRLAQRTPATELQWQPRRLELVAVGVAAFLTLLLLITPSPQQAVLDQQAADALAVQQANARLDAVREAAVASPNLTPDQARQLDELLQQAQAELSRTKTQQQASAVLARTEDQLAQQLGDPNADLRDEALAAMSETLAAEPRTQSLADALQREDARAASQALTDLAAQADQLSDVERQSLSRALQRAANVGRSDPRTANALRDAAQALASGASPDNALSQADAAVRDAIQASQSQTAINATVRQLRDMQSRLATGQPLSQSEEDAMGQAPGSTDSSVAPNGTPVALDARGGGARTVSDPSSGQNGSGAGTDAATNLLPGAAPSDAQAAENVFVPGRVGTGQADQQDVVDQPFSVRGAPRPYREVLSQYAQSSRDYVERPDISPAVRDLVKQYFQELEQGQ